MADDVPKSSRGRIGILCCRGGEPLGRKILACLEEKFRRAGLEEEHPVLVECKEIHFPNGEVKVEILKSVRDMDLYVLQDVENREYDGEPERANSDVFFRDHIPLRNIISNEKIMMEGERGLDTLMEVKRPFSVDEHYRALLTALDAAKRAYVHYLTAVIPVFPYARQDKAISREGITASRIAQGIEGHGADSVLTLDLHNNAITGFFRTATCENLHASRVVIPYLRKLHEEGLLDINNLAVASPDVGGAARANFYAKELRAKLVMGYKERDYSKASAVETFRILGDVVKRDKRLEEQLEDIRKICAERNRDSNSALRSIERVLEAKTEKMDVVYIDDMIATAGSLEEAIDKTRALGAENMWFACSLPLFTYPAVERIDRLYREGKIKGVIGTSAVYHSEDFKKAHPWYHEVPVEEYLADAIFNVNHYLSISDLIKNPKHH